MNDANRLWLANPNTLKIALILIMPLAIFFYVSEVNFSPKTTLITHSNRHTCVLIANSKGVGLHILYQKSLHAITLERPSKLNDFIHRSIKWPSQSDFDIDYKDENIIAGFFSEQPKTIKLKMAHAGGGDGDVSSFDKNDVEIVSSLLEKYKNISIWKDTNTWSGFERMKLGYWSFTTKSQIVELQEFARCVREL